MREQAAAGEAESGINRHFRWEAILMVSLFVVPVIWALAISFAWPLVHSLRR